MTIAPPRVLFVSKPIAPPFHDGTKCLVRDIAVNLERSTPIVMSTPTAPRLERKAGGTVEIAPAYRDSGAFTPSLAQNARAAAYLLARSRADVWHFVFAPNPKTSAMGRALRALRRVPVVQTVASPPRSFERARSLLFGDVVVAQSRWTRSQLESALDRAAVSPPARPRVVVIPPPIGELTARTPEQQARARAELDIDPGVPVFVYPGDLETSTGARTVADLCSTLAAELPGAVIVFAYRAKTPAAPEIARQLAERLDRASTRFTSSPTDVLALISSATAVLFPVDDLWGKVDLPIVLLESMKLGVPVIAIDHGPLSDLAGAELVGYGDNEALGRTAVMMARDQSARDAVRERQLAAVHSFEATRIAGLYEGLYLELYARGHVHGIPM